MVVIITQHKPLHTSLEKLNKIKIFKCNNVNFNFMLIGTVEGKIKIKKGEIKNMKMTYKELNISELKQSLETLLPKAKGFEVELSLEGNAPATLYTGSEVMSLENILELVKKQGFKVNDINGLKEGGVMRECIGISLNKPFIHEKTKESIEGLFILGNQYEKELKNVLFSFLIRAEKNSSVTPKAINFSVDIVEENIEIAKSSFFKKINTFDYSLKEEIKFIPVTYDDGEWVEMEPEEDEGEIRFEIEDLTLEKINELFEGNTGTLQ